MHDNDNDFDDGKERRKRREKKKERVRASRGLLLIIIDGWMGLRGRGLVRGLVRGRGPASQSRTVLLFIYFIITGKLTKKMISEQISR